jgi:hypothetical protein
MLCCAVMDVLSPRRMVPIALALLVSLAPLAACTGSGGAPGGRRVPAATERPAAEPTRRPATPEEMERYAAREQQSAGLEKFEGGRIGTTTIIIILLLVIVIILLV